MKVAIIYNKDITGVINTFGMQNKEFYAKETVRKVASSLEKAGHNVAVLDGNKQIIDRLENFMPRVMEGEQMGMIFNMAYGIQGESRYTHIPSMLEMLGLPYVGSSPSGHALALDKVLTKIIWKNNGLPTPDFWVFNSSEEDFSKVVFPVIVKPKMESVSFGLRVVDNIEDLKEAVDFIVNEFNQQALVEQFIRGREFCVGLLGNSPVETFPILEIDLDGDPDAIQTVEDKQRKPKTKICPAPLPATLAEEMRRLSIEAFKSLNLRDFARVDIRLDTDNRIYLLEVNSMASMGNSGSYPKAAEVAGYNYETLVNKMLDVATVRYFSKTLLTSIPGTKKKGQIPQSSRISSFIKSRQQQTERFLKKIVDINSHFRNVDGVNKCVELINSELSQIGFSHEVHHQLEVGNIVFYSNTNSKEYDFLFILPVDNRVSLSDHESFSYTEQYFEGTSIWENKGGISILLSSLQALKFIRAIKKIKIGIVLVTDSSLDGKYSRKLILEKSHYARNVLSLAGSSRDGGLIISRSGSATFKLEAKLIRKGQAENISLMAAAFNKLLANISDISKNDPENVLAPFDIKFCSNIFKDSAYGSAGISVRYNSMEVYANIEQKIQKLINQFKKNKFCTLHFDGSMKRPAMETSVATEELYKRIHKHAKQIDVRVTSEHRWSSADICHIASNVPRVDGMGPVGEFLTSGNERVLKHSLVERALLLSMVMLDGVNGN